MAKLTNVRERVHQPFRDTLIRTSGLYSSAVQDRTDLFTQAGKNDAESNLKNGSTLPSDQSMVVLALRVFTWFRASVIRALGKCGEDGPKIVRLNGDYGPTADGSTPEPCAPNGVASKLNGSAGGNYHDVYRLHWQAEEQLLWSFGSGQKFSLTSMPTAYFPYGGGIYGDMGHAGAPCCNGTDQEEVVSAESPSPLPIITENTSRCCALIRFTWGEAAGGGDGYDYLVEYYDLATGAWNTANYGNGVSLPFTVSVGGGDSKCFDVTFPSLLEGQTSQEVVIQFGTAGASQETCSPLIHWENGTPDHSGILRLARAILLPPRQNVLCQAQIVRLPDGGNSGIFGATQGARNLLNLTDNLNAVDAVQKVVSFTFDGLFSRDVQ